MQREILQRPFQHVLLFAMLLGGHPLSPSPASALMPCKLMVDLSRKEIFLSIYHNVGPKEHGHPVSQQATLTL